MWFVLSASAQTDCSITIHEHLPADGAQGVPLDVVPLVTIHTPCGAEVITLELRDDTGDLQTLTRQADALSVDDRPTRVEFLLDADLQPTTRYTADVRIDALPVAWFGFVTGVDRAAPIAGIPTLDILHAERYAGLDTPFSAQIGVQPAGDGQLFVLTAGEVEVATLAGSGSDPFEADVEWPHRGDGRRFCLTVQERGHLDWSAPSEPVCASAGCSSGQGHSPGLFGGLLTASLLLRRRRA